MKRKTYDKKIGHLLISKKITKDPISIKRKKKKLKKTKESERKRLKYEKYIEEMQGKMKREKEKRFDGVVWNL